MLEKKVDAQNPPQCITDSLTLVIEVCVLRENLNLERDFELCLTSSALRVNFTSCEFHGEADDKGDGDSKSKMGFRRVLRGDFRAFWDV